MNSMIALTTPNALQLTFEINHDRNVAFEML